MPFLTLDVKLAKSFENIKYDKLTEHPNKILGDTKMWQKVSLKKSKKAKLMTIENDAILLMPMSIAFLMHLKMK